MKPLRDFSVARGFENIVDALVPVQLLERL